ncbi:hypothetical protein JL100_003085 [Skermanella mucosa]|uniref:hypothetical protein n=1 Tax=Skermanella mucosa TaxID=1789672 RepID=UPI00192ADB15|nr:hypothetical protein [Skermanella mucosa]UEM21766.1 hypothetical protein JL100_003085 [Skermanella mucosa]
MIAAILDNTSVLADSRSRLIAIEPRLRLPDPLVLKAQAALSEAYSGESVRSSPLPDKDQLKYRLLKAKERVSAAAKALASFQRSAGSSPGSPELSVGIEEKRKKLMDDLDQAKVEAQEAEEELEQSADGDTNAEKLFDHVAKAGIYPGILKLTQAINGSNLPAATRLILATPGVYEYLLLKLLTDDRADPRDTEGLKQAILVGVSQEPSAKFFGALVDFYLKEARLSLDQRTTDLLALNAAGMNIPLGPPGKVKSVLGGLLDQLNTVGLLPSYVAQYAGRGEIAPTRFTQDIRDRMVSILGDFDLQLTPEGFAKGLFDEYFALAYREAVQSSRRGEDPLDLKHAKGQMGAWDFLVDTFENAEEQGVVKDNILAASVLYYVYVLGDVLGAFQFADALLLRRAKGRLDLSRAAGSKLHAYKLRRNDRMTVDERSHFYRRALNLGEGQVLDGTIVNEDFPQLWHGLMTEVAENIRKNEENSAAEEKASRASIEEAIRLLQYNLSTHMGDMELDVQELYRQFEEVKELLSDPEIIASVGGGRRQNMWTLMERIAAEDFDSQINVAALRTLGVEGWRILQFVANFDGPAPDEEFSMFRKSCESWIIAQAAVGDMAGPGAGGDDDDEDDFGDGGEEDGEEDW